MLARRNRLDNSGTQRSAFVNPSRISGDHNAVLLQCFEKARHLHWE